MNNPHLRRGLRWFCITFSACFWLLLFLSCVVVLSGCHHTGGGEKVPGKQVSEAGQAAGKADDAQAKADAAQKERLGMAAANVKTIIDANAKTPDTPQKATIATEGELALGNIGEPADPVELAKGAERARLQAEGKAAEAQRLADESRKRAEGLSAAEARAITERDQARTERDNALQAAQESIRLANEANARANAETERKHKAEVAALQAKVEAAEVGMLTWIVGGIGGLCLLGAVAVVVLGVNSPAGLSARTWKTAAALVGCAGGCFAIARFLGHPWIPYATGGVLVLIAGWAAWQMVADARARKAVHMETVGKADTYKDLSVALVRNLGEFKAAHPAEWEKLSNVLWDDLTTEQDAVVAELKAELKRAA